MKEVHNTQDLVQMLAHMSAFYDIQQAVMVRLQNLLVDIADKKAFRAKFPEIPHQDATKMAQDMSYAIKESKNLKGFFDSLSQHLITVTKGEGPCLKKQNLPHLLLSLLKRGPLNQIPKHPNQPNKHWNK